VLEEDFSVLEALALAEDFSPLVAFALGDDFSVLAFAVGDEFFSVADVLGFVATFPFAEEVVPLVEGVAFDDGDVFSVRSFAVDAEPVAESAADLGAVSGFTAGAHAQAMTIAISGIRA
jgi:hypothetical protein